MLNLSRSPQTVKIVFIGRVSTRGKKICLERKKNLDDGFHPYRNPEELGIPRIWRFLLDFARSVFLKDVAAGFDGIDGADRCTGFLHGSR
jgi:hypothetical protein